MLPILYLNEFKIRNPRWLARIGHTGLEPFFPGYRWTPIVVGGNDPAYMHQRMAVANDEAMILKPTMVSAGRNCPAQPGVQEVADATVQYLLGMMPAALAGIAFLSSSQAAQLGSSRLNPMHIKNYSQDKSTQDKAARNKVAPVNGARPRRGTIGSAPPLLCPLPTPLPTRSSFWLARVLSQPALDIWSSKNVSRFDAQEARRHRVRYHKAALRGKYPIAMEST